MLRKLFSVVSSSILECRCICLRARRHQSVNQSIERKEGDGLMLSDKRCNRLVTYGSTVVLHHNITGGERQLVVLLDTYNSSSLVLPPPSLLGATCD